MRLYLVITTLLLIWSALLQAGDVWTVKKMGEMTTADFYLLEIGSPQTGILIGKKNSGSNDELLCYFMTNGELWNPCPAAFTNFGASGGAMILGAKYDTPQSLYAIRTEIKGFSATTALVKVDSNFFNMQVLRMFDTKTDTPTGAIDALGTSVWVGTSNGKIFRSTDSGTTFDIHTITADDKTEIYYVKFIDQNKGYAAGGATEETEDSMGGKVTTVLPKGGVWTTNDGGKTWTAVKEGMPYSFMKIMPVSGVTTGDISAGRWYAFYTDDKSYGSGGDVSKHLGITENGFGTLTEVSPTSNTNRKFNGFQAGGIDMVGDSELWLGGMCTDLKACSMVSYDSGKTWLEMFLPTAVAEGTNFMWSIKILAFLDSHHGYAAGSLNTIFKFGDPNEQYTELPDETADTDTELPEADTTVKTDNTPAVDADTAEIIPDTIAPVDDSGCGCSLM